MDYQTLIIFLLFAIGLALIVAEIFIPSGGFIAILSILSFVASVVYAHRVWWESNRDAFWIFCGSTLALIPATVVGTLWLLSRTRLGNGVLLEGPSSEEVDPYAADADERAKLIGQIGQSVTLMTPGGLVSVNGERYHAVTQDGMLDPGQPVVVVAIQGNRMFVRRHQPEYGESIDQDTSSTKTTANDKTVNGHKAATNEDTTADTDRRPSEHSLDFEIPET
ncbi:NfeD family protein [Thalassoroseus pseudoceratinae]|uniref:NfeD family protein n=1 Tax=Thalassoroseus pseudoceratinae TaxID=2713176 RepID=UPI00141FC330|nr:NfeD family protein [Thalassoroseus pseudoceratinae]